ncbi:site-specific integrase [Geodermatophilus sp. TF02-6]|uniref:tyrosine-type recombinase/integrase n=1 Tax=Geodermatophilus sp. TF02-6 TaxID=2250575 RepID=UPI000DE96F5E|nr:site-specific integrase [Geodermatophilus sp. TF02-6]RBY83725.1 site-specific integrase [Geodermatophilus sp. TF02-6]
MASIEKRGGVIFARWRDGDGRQRKASRGPDGKPFTSERKARHYAESQEVDVRRGTYVDRSDRTTVSEWAWDWLATRYDVRDATRARIESVIATHVDGTRLGDRRLVDLRPSEIQAWVADRSKVLAPSTLAKVVGRLRQLLAAAVDDGRIPYNPADRVKRPRAPRREKVTPPTVAQVRAIAEAMPPRYRALVIVQAATGLRVGELLALRPRDVDFLSRPPTVTVAAQVDHLTRQRVDWCKSDTSRRTVPLPEPVRDVLAAHLAAFPVDRDAAIFGNGRATGRPVTRHHYNQMLHRACTAVGVPDLTSHMFRHHAGSVLLAEGRPDVDVAEHLGHANTRLVQEVYGHPMPDGKARTLEALERVWSDAAGALRAPAVP